MAQNSRRKMQTLAAIILGGLAAISVGKAQGQPAKVLTVVPSADLPNIDPVFASVVITRIFGMMVYEQLFSWDSDLQPKPQMVESWTTSPDGLSWRFTLRAGQKFHDGAPVTSADVIALIRTPDSGGLYRPGIPTRGSRHSSGTRSRPSKLDHSNPSRPPQWPRSRPDITDRAG